MADRTGRDVGVEKIDVLVDEFLAAFPPASTDVTTFLGEQFDRGLAWPHFAPGSGGLGVSPSLLGHVVRRMAAAGAPSKSGINVIGHGMVAPTIAVHGTDAQKQRYLRPIFTGEEIWCQLFSEPGAGSDVAGLATRAVKDGDEWIVNGQKVWTTLAHISAFGLLLARTDPDLPKHRGMTAFLVDMHGEGVEVRPLYQATGEAEFNECFFTDAHVPDTERIGGVGEGWNVAITTLMNERVSIGSQVPPRGSGPIAHAVAAFEERFGSSASHEAIAQKDRLMMLWVQAEVTRLTNLRASDSRKAGTPGPEGSVAKLAFAELNQKIYSLAVDLLGPEGMLYNSDYPKIRPSRAILMTSDLQKSFIRVQANSIEGGTSLIMRNILAERVLGMPGEVRNDKDVPWNEIPRS